MGELKARGVSGTLRQGVGGAAGETLKRTGAAARGATSAVSDATGMEAVEGVGEHVQAAAGGAGGALKKGGGGGGKRTVGAELREIVREAALEVLVPVARRATTEAAKYAIRRGPQLARDTIAPKLADTLRAAIDEAGGPGALAKGALSSVSGARAGLLEKVGIGGETPSPLWRERRLPVEESVDVVVPLDTAYDAFTEFEEYARFMSRGETVDERPDERIAWERTDGVEATAIITFHRLSDRLTRVMVTYDHQPQGLVDKTTSLFHSSRRGLNEDLMRFKAFVEMSEDGTETPEEPEQQAEAPRARKRSRRDEGGHAEEAKGAEAEPEAEYEDQPEGEYDEEEEPPAAPGRTVRHHRAARPRRQKARRG